jgi:hypothetical protein
MTAAATSRLAYDEIRSTGKLNEQQKKIMAVIVRGRDYSLQELVMLSGLPINVVSGRVNELKKSPLELLERAPTRKCTLTGSTIHPVRLPALEGG